MNVPPLVIFILTIAIELIRPGAAISCYQCDSRVDPDCKEDFGENPDQLIIRSTDCTVHDAQYCIKTTGVWGGIVGTTRFCSSRDMFNSCQYVEFADHDRIYRACIFTCTSDGCNGSVTVSPSLAAIAILAAVSAAFVTLFC